VTDTIAKLTDAHRQEAEHFDAYWRGLFDHGKIELTVPPDEVIWQRDLGCALRVAFEWLGDLRGRRVLELGCGSGDHTVMLARRGARVTALDIAPASLEITRQRAQVNGMTASVQPTWMAAEELGFPDGAFDWVVGFGLLHHADPEMLGPELRRVLRSNGRVLFFEPLGTNPVLEFARKHLPYRGKHHSLNERPLTEEQIREISKNFGFARQRTFYLFSMISRVIGSDSSFPWLWQLDEFLIRNFPVVRRWCRYVLLEYAV
jgi:ubiquinone/menaquinone biosynthesis C-methylase UbiE